MNTVNANFELAGFDPIVKHGRLSENVDQIIVRDADCFEFGVAATVFRQKFLHFMSDATMKKQDFSYYFQHYFLMTSLQAGCCYD